MTSFKSIINRYKIISSVEVARASSTYDEAYNLFVFFSSLDIKKKETN